jgi:hypothetical protein
MDERYRCDSLNLVRSLFSYGRIRYFALVQRTASQGVWRRPQMNLPAARQAAGAYR